MKSERDKHAEMFADYMIDAMARTRLRQADIARSTGLSRQVISQIVGKKPHGLTGKLLLPERETVDKIAKAFGDPVSQARQAAGYSTTEILAEPDSIEDALKNAMFFDQKGLSAEDIEKIRPLLQVVDREVDRLKKDDK